MSEISNIKITVQKDRQRFKIDDKVIVTNPEFVTRVGYPMSYEDAYKYIEQNYVQDIEDLLETKLFKIEQRNEFLRAIMCSPTKDKNFNQIMHGMARIYLDSKGHGGKERSIHIITKPEMLGKVYMVIGKRVVKTGTYYGPWSHCSYEGEWESGSGGLDNCKTHIILELQDYTMYGPSKWDGCWIESKNVRKYDSSYTNV